MSGPRVDRIAEQIRAIVGDILIRQEIKDPRVWDAGLITITHVKVTGDLQQARIDFMVHGLDDKRLIEVEHGLNRAAGYVRHRLRRELPIKVTPTVKFRVDRVFDSEERVERVFQEIANARPPAPAGEAEGEPVGGSKDPADGREG